MNFFRKSNRAVFNFFLAAACLFFFPLIEGSGTVHGGTVPDSHKAQNSAFNLLQDVVDNQDKLTLEGVKLTAYWWNHNRSVQATHIFKKNGLERFDYFPAKGHGYQEVVVNGDYVYHENPGKHLAYRSPYQSSGPKEDAILSLAERNYSWIDEGEEKIAGYPARRIAAVSKHDSQTVGRFWVDPEHRAILREERYDEAGKPVFFSSYLNVNFPENLPDSLFQLRDSGTLRNVPPPKELEGEKALKALDFQALTVGSVPHGFALVGTYLTQWSSHHKLQWRYSDGLRNFSVYENARQGSYHPLRGSATFQSPDGRSFEMVEAPQGKLIRFGQDGVTVAVIGNIPLQMAAQVALGIGNSAPTTPIHRLSHYFRKGLNTLKRWMSRAP